MTTDKISRRHFLKNTSIAGAGVAATTALAAPAVLAQAPITLKMQSSWPSSDIFQEMAQQYVERVEEMAGGRLKIDLLPAGAVVGAFQVQDACHDGILDAAHTVPVYWYGKNKAASLFGTGPVFGANATEMIAWMYHGGGHELYRELTQDVLGLNIVGFFAFGMPAQPFGWFKEEITSADQVAGLKYRTVGLAADLFQAMGAAVAQLPGGEIVPAMERGVIDAFEFNNPTSDSRFGAQDVAKNYMLASYHQASESFEFIFNKDKYESLPPDLQAILKYGVEAVHLANTALALNQYSADLEKLQNEAGVNVKRTPDDVLKTQLDAWDEILPPLMEDPFFAKVVESQKVWCERVVFYSLQNAPDYRLAYQHYYPGKL
ncbi:twin-arginine translocation signal domain-containing protein [Nitratireductor sp. CAU 1489]|uniref:Twin-arginine translocation signal domain-containing protein n=1 Tax=Nitratireductor arenosus TaxID=2682096 RepID=A0A844Q8M5_9HYPH|nr:TRAP transporter substrate-binding protein [Nitratireductor arenosus]MVA96446.1 twin-arginine translocation signal domain-containing protein [Nitratireductor arenosus]